MLEDSERVRTLAAWRNGLCAMAGWAPGGAVPAPRERGLRDVFWLALAAAIGAVLMVQAVALWRLDYRSAERERILDETREALLAQTWRSATLSGVVAAGLSDATIKDLARGIDLPLEQVQQDLARIRARLPVLGVYVFNHAGYSMAQDDGDDATPGPLQAFQPYIRQALLGKPSVFAALDGGRRARALFHVAPVRADREADSSVLGVVVFKTDAAALDAVLQRIGLTTLLLNPQGVAFSSTRAEWRYAMTGPLTQERIDSVRQSRLFGTHFDNGMASALPFAADSTEVRVNGVRYAVDRRALDWRDPVGDWHLVALDNVSALMPWRDRWMVALLSFSLFMLVGALGLRLRWQQRRLSDVRQRHEVLCQALYASPMAAVLTDADGHILWANARYEQDSGYALDELLGHKPSMVASGHTPQPTYRDLWSTLIAGHAWEGCLLNCDRHGKLHHVRLRIMPVLDDQGRRIAIVGWQQRLDDAGASSDEPAAAARAASSQNGAAS